ncbi:MAG: hypothetical protein OXP73_10125, partial [Chloroflexota bacterium]|nr:hypothetical protein [Chloroflexota bacterium]
MSGRTHGRRLALGLLIAALAAAALVAAACGPGGDSLHPDASHRRVYTLSDPTWRVAPSLTEQIVRSTTIVRATLQSTTAAVVAEPDGGGYRPVQELRFTTHEYLKGSGPATLLVAVRGGATYATEAGARAAAEFATAGRVTTWDDRQAVLFLRTAHPTYAPVGSSATDATVAAGALAFVLSNPTQSSWAYSVDTLSRVWLPAEDPPAEGVTPTAFITDGAPTPPPTITLADLRAQIRELEAEFAAGASTPGFDKCVNSRILRERFSRAEPWTPSQLTAPLSSGEAAGTDVYRNVSNDSDPQYYRYWIGGPDAALFEPIIVDDDGQSSTGYTHLLRAVRPLPTGDYRLSYSSQIYVFFPCRFVPLDAHRDITVQVTA